MAKSFEYFELHKSHTASEKVERDWNLCIICQETRTESLNSPARSKRRDRGKGYATVAHHLEQFSKLNALPRTLQLPMLDEGGGIEATLIAHEAKWHHKCMLKYNTKSLQETEKRAKCSTDCDRDSETTRKRTRLQSPSSQGHNKDSCFFCGEKGEDLLHESSTFQLDDRVRKSAEIAGDYDLLSKLSKGDMVAQDAKYHRRCLLDLYYRANRSQKNESIEAMADYKIASISLADLIMHIEESRLEQEKAPVFKLADLVSFYAARLKHYGVAIEGRINSTHLKDRILKNMPHLKAQRNGRDILLAFEDDLGEALGKVCQQENDSDAIHLARAAQIVRREMFDDSARFNGYFTSDCQEKSVPSTLLTLVGMLIEGEYTKNVSSNTAALSVSQLLKYNAVKQRRKQPKENLNPASTKTIKHTPKQETPLPIYIGLLLHAETRKRGLVEKLHDLGLSISYDRVLRISAEMGNKVSQMYRLEQVVCPPTLKGGVFTTAAVDNIDHNPSSTTSKDSFHGTAISLLQHPTYPNEGVHRNVPFEMDDANSKHIKELPVAYSAVTPIESSIKASKIPHTDITSITAKNTQEYYNEQEMWLEHTRQNVQESDSDEHVEISWAAYHAKHQNTTEQITVTPTALLPMFQEAAHSAAMIKHSMNVIKDAVDHINPGQTPVITVDQPLFAIAKQLQWKWPEIYGEDKMVIVLGGLHIEMAALKALGKWLEGSGWDRAIVQANIANAGTADSFLRATHISRTLRAHQVTACALYIIQRQAYDSALSLEGNVMDFKSWCSLRQADSPQFLYWSTVLDLEIAVLIYVHSLRVADFNMYVNSLVNLAPWFFALDQTNYARWTPVHIRDMKELPHKHPHVYRRFCRGDFTAKKTTKPHSAMPMDQNHEQNNARVKGDGGAIGLTSDPHALLRWMVAGPEIARVIEEFETSNPGAHDVTHHDQIPSVQKSFKKDVAALVATFNELGNPFEEESKDLLVLDSKDVAHSDVVQAIHRAKYIGQHQFETFVKERFLEKSKDLDQTVQRNRLSLFKARPSKPTKEKQQIVSAKSDAALFCRLYIACQTRDGNLEEFFSHENQAFPPTLSVDSGKLRIGKKSDLLTCLDGFIGSESNSPLCTAVVLDGAVLTQMLLPRIGTTFGQYADQIFIPYLEKQLTTSDRLDLVWDSYNKDSLKKALRVRRGTGVRRRVESATQVPKDWQSFLRVDANKVDLFSFLTRTVIHSMGKDSKELVVTDGEEVICIPSQNDVTDIAPCTHEEADSRMMVHVSHVAAHGHRKILIRTVDTDVVVLAVMVSANLPFETELWIAFGTAKSFRYIPAHEISASIGPDRSRALPLFHALTGCDTVSSFAGHGKKSAWSTWNAVPQLTDALLHLTNNPASFPQMFSVIERFVVLLYDRSSKAQSVNKARRKLFPRKNSIERIPPTQAVLEQHMKRAIYQGSYIWGQALNPRPVVPSPCDWGWEEDDDSYKPLWNTLPEAAKSCQELIACNCTKGCRKWCKCKKANLPCTELCLCDGEC